MQNFQISLNPYLSFQGNCREAMTFYKNALGGELELMPYDGAPMEYPPECKDYVMHASLKFGNSVIMAADSMPGMPLIQGNNNSLSISSNDVPEGERIFNAISAGGMVTMPFADTFWGAKFGMCIDKFGMNWMVNCDLPQAEDVK